MSEQNPAGTSQPAAVSPPVRTRGRLAAALALLLAIAAAGLAGWQWYDSRVARSALEQDLARRLAEVEARARDARSVSEQARGSLRDIEARMGQLEARLLETQSQRYALESLYQELSRSRDEWVLAEVEQILLLASQQLQLAGNVKAALLALETADARLARADRPQLIPLRRVIGNDMERLKSSPNVDVTGLGLKLERVLDGMDELPLAVDARAPTTQAVESSPDAPVETGWRRLVNELRQDIRGLVRVQRMDTPEPLLLGPEQAFVLRENLKLRLLSARIALLSRDGAGFKTDVASALRALQRHFDSSSQQVKAAAAALQQLAATDIGAEPPSINASLDAARNLRFVRERNVR
jgi:uroporphyrin-3 C-methyltransferase